MTNPARISGNFLSPQHYRDAFETERHNDYLSVRAFERRMGFEVERGRLETAAAVLACPVKVNLPNWQHGRVIYSTLRKYLAWAADQVSHMTLLDIGTAKGFSALCIQWAVTDSQMLAQIVSVDVIDPEARVARNTVADFWTDNCSTLAEDRKSVV